MYATKASLVRKHRAPCRRSDFKASYTLMDMWLRSYSVATTQELHYTMTPWWINLSARMMLLTKKTIIATVSQDVK